MVAPKTVENDGRQFRVLATQRSQPFYHCDTRAEAAMRLRHFHADGTATDDDEVSGAFLVFEEILVGEEGNLVEAGNGRRRCARPRGDDEAPRGDLRIARKYGAAVAEARMILDDGDAEPLEARRRIVRGNGADDAVDVLVHFCEIDFRLSRRDTEGFARAHAIGLLRRCEKRLGRHAAGVQAIAAHRVAFYEHRTRAHLRSACRDRQAAGAGADDTDVSLYPLGHGNPRRVCGNYSGDGAEAKRR